ASRSTVESIQMGATDQPRDGVVREPGRSAAFVGAAFASVPADATILVATHRRDMLPHSIRHRTWPFPQAALVGTGTELWTTSVIAHLEVLRARGADYLLLPGDILRRLDPSGAFQRHVSRRYRVVLQFDIGLLVNLREPSASSEESAARALVESFEEL